MAKAWKWANVAALVAALMSGIRGPVQEIALFLAFVSQFVWLLRYGERDALRYAARDKSFLRHLVTMDDQAAVRNIRGVTALLALVLCAWVIYAIVRLLGIGHQGQVNL